MSFSRTDRHFEGIGIAHVRVAEFKFSDVHLRPERLFIILIAVAVIIPRQVDFARLLRIIVYDF